jgi:excisionase family DNA binding protein
MPDVLDTRWLTVADLARQLKQSQDTIRRKIAAGEIPAVRLGPSGPLRIAADELEKHLRPAVGRGRAGRNAPHRPVGAG